MLFDVRIFAPLFDWPLDKSKIFKIFDLLMLVLVVATYTTVMQKSLYRARVMAPLVSVETKNGDQKTIAFSFRISNVSNEREVAVWRAQFHFCRHITARTQCC